MINPFKFRPPVVSFSKEGRRGLERFRKRAREAYPREHMECLVGTIARGKVVVEEFVEVPSLKGDEGGAGYETSDLLKIRDAAVRRGKTFLGTLHTHPDVVSNYLSEDDHLSVVADELLIGSLRVTGRFLRQDTKLFLHERTKHVRVAKKPYFEFPHVIKVEV